MKRLLLVLSSAAIMAAVMTVSALAAFAAPNANSSLQGEIAEGNAQSGTQDENVTTLCHAVNPCGEGISGVNAQANKGHGQ